MNIYNNEYLLNMYIIDFIQVTGNMPLYMCCLYSTWKHSINICGGYHSERDTILKFNRICSISIL